MMHGCGLQKEWVQFSNSCYYSQPESEREVVMSYTLITGAAGGMGAALAKVLASGDLLKLCEKRPGVMPYG